ncbi:MucR family transcriptional regulator [Roseibium album]|uniref:MucR family transcriptional regulator n=1 Tax=Roseibium album TaxID=311410 RepID=UPI0032F0746B
MVCKRNSKKPRKFNETCHPRAGLITPEQYREKWGLDVDYPMVAPNYAAARSKLAKKMGFGQKAKRGKK